jgi:cell wall-associated NlpC family hydrolase
MRLIRLTIVAASLSMAACASTGGVPEPFPRPGPRPTRAPVPKPVGTTGTSLPGDGYSIAGTALGLRGVPYRNGGSDPKGFDCSGLIEYVFSQHGISVPRTVEEQHGAGVAVSAQDIQPGDLVFFDTTGEGASHVGMAIGGDEFVHAPSGAGVVRVERLGTAYWSQRFVGAKRVVSR